MKYKQKIFRRGMIVEYQGAWREVENVVLSNMQLFVNLKDIRELVHEDDIQGDLTEYELVRS